MGIKVKILEFGIEDLDVGLRLGIWIMNCELDWGWDQGLRIGIGD